MTEALAIRTRFELMLSGRQPDVLTAILTDHNTWWCDVTDLNRRPPEPQSDVLPTELTPPYIIGGEGRTSHLQGLRHQFYRLARYYLRSTSPFIGWPCGSRHRNGRLTVYRDSFSPRVIKLILLAVRARFELANRESGCSLSRGVVSASHPTHHFWWPRRDSNPRCWIESPVS